jgi:hypothetical protein
MDERDKPTHVERETVVVSSDRGGGGGGAIAVIVIVLALAVLAFLFFGGYFNRAADEIGVNVNVEAPNVKMPDINIDTAPSQAPANKS